jgi:hypothetical protein
LGWKFEQTMVGGLVPARVVIVNDSEHTPPEKDHSAERHYDTLSSSKVKPELKTASLLQFRVLRFGLLTVTNVKSPLH